MMRKNAYLLSKETEALLLEFPIWSDYLETPIGLFENPFDPSLSLWNPIDALSFIAKS